MAETLLQIENEILLNRQFQSFSDIQSSLSSSTNSFTSIAEALTGRLMISNSLNEDLILPINYYNLNEVFYWGSAFTSTQVALNNIIQNYPIGASGNATGTLWLEDIEHANDFIATLDNWEFFVLQQLCGWSLTNNGNLTFTGSATSVSVSMSGSSTVSSANTYILPVLNRDQNNFLLWPQGPGDAVTLDAFYSNMLTSGQSPDYNTSHFGSLSYMEQILTTAVGFDAGFVNINKPGWAGTGSDTYLISSSTGMSQTQIVPDVFLKNINRQYAISNLVSPVIFYGDNQNIAERFLNALAKIFDETKQLIDGLKHIYRNYWGNWDRLPQGYIQELIAREAGIQLFSSQQREIVDNLKVRGTYLTDTQVTFQFWNRILCSLVSILKSKGTIESINRVVRAYGLPSSLIEVYELASYQSYATGYINETNNHAIAQFRPNENIDPYNKIFQAVSADLTSLSISTQALSVHSKICFFDDLFDGARAGLSGTIYSLNPDQLSLSYQYTYDTANESTSGFPYIQFTLNAGSETLITNYDFIQTGLNQNYGTSQGTNYFTIISGIDTNAEMFIELGFVQSNYEYFPPVLNTLTGSVGSLSGTYFNPTEVVVGDYSNTPNINLGYFYIQKVGMNVNHFTNLVLDSDYLASQSGYEANILAWKFNEYVTLDQTNQNFILDATTNSITGQPTFYGISGNPYAYIFDDPSFFNDNIPGFKLQKMYNAQTQTLVDKNLRVGISMASPIDVFIHNMFGSIFFGELYANPNDFYDYTITDSNATYSLVEQTNTELFEAAGAQSSDVNIGEFLKYLNRIGGHLGSFFQFIEQVIPASKRILEKGIVFENPINNRIIITKASIKEQHNLETDASMSYGLALTGNDIQNIAVNLNEELSFSGTYYNNLIDVNVSTTISGSGSLTDFGATSFSIDNILNVPTNGSVFSDFSNFDILESISSIGNFTQAITGVIASDSMIVTSGIQPLQIPYIPSKIVNNYTLQNLKMSQIENDFLPQNDYLQYQPPQHALTGTYFLHLNFDNSYVLLSTSLTADASIKSFVGTVFIEDLYGRRVATNFPAFQVNFGQAQYNGLNSVNFSLDGQYVPYNTKVASFPISSLSGVQFQIDTIGSVVDGIDANKQVTILFSNLLNATDQNAGLQFVLGFSMENYSSTVGTGIST